MHLWYMTELELPGGIGDEQIGEAAPMVRALVVSRLETIWRTCQPHIEGKLGRPDPRFVEAGIRVLDRLIRLYRLDVPVAGKDDGVMVVDGAEVLDRRLQELMSRVTPGQE